VLLYSHRRVSPRFPDLRPIGAPIPDSRPNRESGDFPIPVPGQVGNRGFPPRFPAKSGIGAWKAYLPTENTLNGKRPRLVHRPRAGRESGLRGNGNSMGISGSEIPRSPANRGWRWGRGSGVPCPGSGGFPVSRLRLCTAHTAEIAAESCDNRIGDSQFNSPPPPAKNKAAVKARRHLRGASACGMPVLACRCPVHSTIHLTQLVLFSY
jgi:hypothetical protein